MTQLLAQNPVHDQLFDMGDALIARALELFQGQIG
jgi:hypothetical protein